MTSEQITTILGEIGEGYPTDDLIDLEEVAEIILISNENLYPEKTTRFYFDTVHSLLLVVYGKMDGENFVSNANESYSITFDEIQGFILSTPVYAKSPYKQGSQM